VKPPKPSAVRQPIKHWRERRRLSQLSLAVDAEISTRHLSFNERARQQHHVAARLRAAGLRTITCCRSNSSTREPSNARDWRRTPKRAFIIERKSCLSTR